jgi:hypothetical protein
VTVIVVEETVYVPGVGHVVTNGVGKGVFECECDDSGEKLERFDIWRMFKRHTSAAHGHSDNLCAAPGTEISRYMTAPARRSALMESFVTLVEGRCHGRPEGCREHDQTGFHVVDTRYAAIVSSLHDGGGQ